MKFFKKYKFEILMFLTFLVFAFFAVPKYVENDTFYSLAIGRDILKYGVDMVDHYSFIDLPYMYPHWLYDLVISQIYKYFNFEGLYAFSMIICMLGSFIVYRYINKNTNNRLFAFIFAILFSYLIGCNMSSRAHTVSYIILLLEIINIDNFLKTGKYKYIIYLYLLLILLFNVHMALYPVYYVIFIPFIVEYLIACLLEKMPKLYKSKETKFSDYEIVKYDNMKILFIFMLFSITAAFVTPVGFKNALSYIFLNKSGDMIPYITEHQNIIILEQPYLCITLVFTLICILLFRIKARLSDMFMILGFLLLALSAVRNKYLFFLVWVLLFGRIISMFISSYDKKTSDAIIKLLCYKFIYPICLILLVVMTVFTYNIKSKMTFLGVENDHYPIKATEYIKKNLDYKNIRLYNEYNFGSYLLFNDIKVFVDSRCDLYEQNYNHLDRSIILDTIELNKKNYKKIFKHYDISHILLYKKHVINETLKTDNNYKKIYSDKSYVLYERKKN